jgi:hypothetical protein
MNAQAAQAEDIPVRVGLSRSELLKRLGDTMSDVSQRCYCAGWMGDTTPAIERLCRAALRTNQPQPWGYEELSVAEAAKLWELAEQIGGWAEPDWDADVFDPIDSGVYVVGLPFTPLYPERRIILPGEV